MDLGRIIVSIFFGLFFILPSLASELSQFVGLQSEENSERLIANIEFDGPVDSSQVVVEYINQTIQLYIPGTKIAKDKDFQSVSHAKVASFYTYQLGKKGIRSRIIYKSPIAAEDFKGFVDIQSQGNVLQVIVDYNKMSSATSVAETRSIPVIPPVDISAENKVSPTQSVLFEIDEKLDSMSAEEIVQREIGSESIGVKTESQNPIASTKRQGKSVSTESASTKRQGPAKIRGNGSTKGVRGELNESQIPVLDQVKSKKETSGSAIYRMLVSLAVIALIGIGVGLFARWWKRQSVKSLGDNSIRVMTQHHLGPKKTLAIVRVAGEAILIGVTDHNISMIKTLSLIDDELEEEEGTSEDFEKTLNKLTQDEIVETQSASVSDRVSVSKTLKSTSSEKSRDEVSYGQIKNLVSEKLKQMRSL